MKEKAKLEDEKKDEEKEDPKGIPDFWLTVFKNVDLLSEMLQVSRPIGAVWEKMGHVFWMVTVKRPFESCSSFIFLFAAT